MKEAAITWAASLLLFTLTTQAQSSLPLTSDIREIVTLPTVTGLKAVVSEGELVFISDNGRFAIKGTLYDTWHKTRITSLAALKQLSNTLYLDKLGVKLNELEPLILADNPVATTASKVVVFVDPRCPHCHKLLQQAKRLSDQFTFQIVALPLLSRSSTDMVRQLGCAQDKQQALKALLSGQYQGLIQQPDCDTTPMHRALITGNILGIKAVPFLIAPDGRTFQGVPPSLRQWLLGD